MLIDLFQIGNLAIDILKSITARVDGVHLADSARPNPFAELADGAGGMTLIAKLRHDFVLVGGSHERADFMDIMSQRLFAIDMLAAPHGFHSNDGMSVIGCADDDSIDLLTHLIEHHAIIFELPGIGIFGEQFASVFGVHIAKGDDVLSFRRYFINIRAAPAANAYAGDI